MYFRIWSRNLGNITSTVSQWNKCSFTQFWTLFSEAFLKGTFCGDVRVFFLYFFKLKFLSFLISVFVIKAKFFSFRTEKFPNKLFLNWGQDRTLKETHWNCFLSQWYYTMYNTGSFAHLREIKTILEDSSAKPICTVSLMAI